MKPKHSAETKRLTVLWWHWAHNHGRPELTPSLPKADLETGQYTNSLCPEVAQNESPATETFLRPRGEEGEVRVQPVCVFKHGGTWLTKWPGVHAAGKLWSNSYCW